VLIGNSGTGKTNITTRYMKGEFYEDLQATVGVEFYSNVLRVRDKLVKITLWDTAGQERYRSLSKVYYKGARGVLAVYDITDPQSYIDIQNWLRLASTPPPTQTRPSTSAKSPSLSSATRQTSAMRGRLLPNAPRNSSRRSSTSTAGKFRRRLATT
jgi:GTPase SAR1 family protein